MREEDEPNWFARWEEELPTPDELMPLSQTLITPGLAVAFDIPTSPTDPLGASRPRPTPQPPPHLSLPQDDTPPPAPPAHQYDSPELGAGGGGSGPGDEPARTLKRPRLVWTPQLHKRFVDAVAHLGIKNAVPKTIMQLMNVDGLTRENVASHLQKYRLYLKRMQGLPSGAAGAGGPALAAADAATEHLFASAPVPHHFLSRGPAVPRGGEGTGAGGGGVPDQFVPFVQVSALQHHQQMAAAAAAAAAQQQHPHYYHHQRHMGHMGSPPGGGFDHGYLMRQQPAGIQRPGGAGGAGIVASTLTGSYAGDLDQGAGADVGRRKELTLFPTGLQRDAVITGSVG
ncbi:hypothetical protein Taro_044303 [Colocasia esculenta]|uniref:HTH myb-type domain-containing protein n=1 Tax=Colocasia esculenta TaxID=4460 RepID=A0A843WIS6_COLES|nr:hypothetical protein [Colocasia esculenta]